MPHKKCICGCGIVLTGMQKKWASEVCRSKFRCMVKRAGTIHPLRGNTYGSLNRGESHAPVFNRRIREKFDDRIDLKQLRGLAAQILLNVCESIENKTVRDNERTDWKKDLNWTTR